MENVGPRELVESLRQDAGFGVNIRILRIAVAQAYFAGGRGGGLHPGFNLVKQF
jgi:hypothetical protein